MRSLLLALALLAATSPLRAQPSDTCKIFIWDNDAGECAQEYPATMIDDDDYCFSVWADMRDGNWNIYGQKTRFDGRPMIGNFLVNQNSGYNYGGQKNPGISGINKDNRFAVVWQDSTNSTRYRIRARIFTISGEPTTGDILVSINDLRPKFRPRVAMHKYSGRFVIVWTEYSDLNNSNVYARLLGPDGGYLSDTILVNQHVSGERHHRRPAVCCSDSGIVVVWEDWRNGDYPCIWAQRFDLDLRQVGNNYRVSGPSNHAYYPDVSTVSYTEDGFHAVVWEDRGTGSLRNVFMRKFTWRDTLTGPVKVNPTALTTSYAPTVAVQPDQGFVVAWHDSVNGNVKRQVFARYCPRNSEPANILRLWDDSTRNQSYPSVSANDRVFTVAWHDSLRPTGRGDIFGQSILVEDLSIDTIAKYRTNYRIDNLRANGRKVWYYPRKNFDNPATTGWNEDPIAEPDSIRIPLDSAFVRAFATRNNVPGQQFFKITDSPILQEDYPSNWKSSINGGDYDLCVVDLGYAEGGLGAGEISDNQQDSIMKFSDDGGALLCSGGDFGEMYDGTTLYDGYFAANYDGPGNPYTVGNVDSLGGMTGTFTQGMKFHYPFQEEPDNSIDFISPGSSHGTSAQTIFMNDGPGPVKWSYCRGIAYAAYWKRQKTAQRSNIYIPFAMGSLISDGIYPNTQDELSRRILGYQGFNVEPAPIHDLVATAGSTEGRVNLSWTAVCDDNIGDPVNMYRLKYSHYNAGAGDKGMLSSEQDYIDSGIVYYSTWFTPGAFGTSQSQALYGFPPGDTLILAMKAGDESTNTRWSELGAEPRVVVPGDRVTPHSLGLGYNYGCVNDFISTERIGIRFGIDDTLFCTWDANNIYFGYGRCDWRTAGDLLIYMDTRSGGADSTYDYNGSGQKSAFDVGGDFKPDYVFILDSDASHNLRYWDADLRAWRNVVSSYTACLDSVNDHEYLEIGIPFSSLGNYDTTRAFRYLAVCQQENTNDSWNAFPTQNTPGKGAKTPASYPYYYEVAGGLRGGLEPASASHALSVELSEFSALAAGGGITLNWRTESEVDNYQWLIDRSLEPDANYQRVATVPGQGSSPTGHSYSFTDNSVLPGCTYYYLLGDQDFNENVTWHGPVSVFSGEQSLVFGYCIDCHPNPATGKALISFSLPKSETVGLSIYDIAGRLVRSFDRKWLGTGRHVTRWDCSDQDGRKVPSGVYFYRLAVEGGNALKGRLAVIR